LNTIKLTLMEAVPAMDELGMRLALLRHGEEHQYRGGYTVLLVFSVIAQGIALQAWFLAGPMAWLHSTDHAMNAQRGVNMTPVRSYDEYYTDALQLSASAHVVFCVFLFIMPCYNVTALGFYRTAHSCFRWRLAICEQLAVLVFLGPLAMNISWLQWLVACVTHIRHLDLLYVYWYECKPPFLPLLWERPWFHERELVQHPDRYV
jgi:hypothetical protein